jgi:hypothetical protein
MTLKHGSKHIMIFTRPTYKNGNLRPAGRRMVCITVLFERCGTRNLVSCRPWFDRHTATIDIAKAARDWCENNEVRYVGLIESIDLITDWAGDRHHLSSLSYHGARGFSMRGVFHLASQLEGTPA